MRLTARVVLVATLVVLASWLSHTRTAAQERRPNILLIVMDDVGYADVGFHGSRDIRTPNIDRLAKEGLRLTHHYSGNAVCAPSRCVLMTGKHPGHAFIRNNRSTPPEGQYPIPDETVTMVELFQKLGYVTGGFGKWGLGGPDSSGMPTKQGINRWFGYYCQGVAHNHYPTYLWSDDQRFPVDNPEFSAHQKLPADADPNDPASYKQYEGKHFAMDLITEQAVKFVQDNKDQPFFLYYPTIIPHMAMQVPADSLAEYKDAFPEKPHLGERGYLPHLTPHAAYAAMITRMDRHVGMIVKAVQEAGLDERTIFVFSSDNGTAYDGYGGTDDAFFNSAGGLRGRKGSLYEGGVRVPTIVRWKGHIAAGDSSDFVSGLEDWLPTLLDLAGVKERTPSDIDGISLAPTLLGQSQPARLFLYREFPAYGGQQSVRVGDWKGIRQNLMAGGGGKAKNKAKAAAQPNMHIELYNLKSDPREEKDVSAEHPDMVAQIATLMKKQHVPSKEFPFPALDNQ
jgi:arylsulfatase A-like enzyme